MLDGEGVVGEALRGVVSRLGVRVLDASLLGERMRERLAGAVQRPTLRGMLRALGVANQGSFEHVCQRMAVLSNADKETLRKFLLDPRFMVRSECSTEAAAMVLALPMHEFWGGEPVEGEGGKAGHEGRGAELGPIETQKLPPGGAMEQLLTAQFVRSSGEHDAAAYRFLGVGVASLAEFYVHAVFPRLADLDKQVCEDVILAMLEQLPVLCREDARFWDRLAHLAFLPTAAGALARPGALYDASATELQELLDGGEFYPAPAFQRADLSAVLVRLGLKTSLNRAGVLALARKVAAEAAAGGGSGRARGAALLRHLDAHYAALTAESPLSVAGKVSCGPVPERLHACFSSSVFTLESSARALTLICNGSVTAGGGQGPQNLHGHPCRQDRRPAPR